VLYFAVVGKPVNPMDKFNMDWFPTRELGHNKVDIAALEAAHKRAQRMKQKESCYSVSTPECFDRASDRE